MNCQDLQELKNRIHRLGKNVREQENFYCDINMFLHRVYQPVKQSKQKSEAQPKFV